MSKNIMEIHKKIEEDKVKDFEKRKNAMFEDIKKLSAQYKIDLIAVIQATQQGIYPMIAFMQTPEKPPEAPAEPPKEKSRYNIKGNQQRKVVSQNE